MAKSSRSKTKDSSIHSRAARRAASPPSRTLTDLPRPSPSHSTHHASPHHYGGISKKKSKVKILSRAQRLRRQKGVQRAEAVLDQLEVKTSSSVKRGKQVRTRGVSWDDLNTRLGAVGARLGGNKMPGDEDDSSWEDEEDAARRVEEEREQGVIEGVEALKVVGGEEAMKPPDGNDAGASGMVELEDEVL